jgi:hypothetical protein
MILSEIVTYVCGKIGRTDEAFKTRVRNWAQLRRDMLWQQQQWKDALAIYTKAVTAGQSTVLMPAQVARVVACKQGSSGLLPVEQVFLLADNPQVWDQAGTPTEFSRLAPSGLAAALPTAGEMLNLVSSNAADVGKKVTVHGELAGEEITELVTLNGTNSVGTAAAFDQVRQLSKEATAGLVTVTGNTSGATLLRLTADQTEKRHARIGLHPVPGAALTLAVLAKLNPPPLKQDSDATGLPSLDTALLAFVLADALEGMRQYAKAGAKMEEGNAVLAAAKHNEVWQEHGGSRLLPADAMAEDRPWE